MRSRGAGAWVKGERARKEGKEGVREGSCGAAKGVDVAVYNRRVSNSVGESA